MTPKSFKARFIEPGIISYDDSNAGVVLVSKEALDRMAPTFKGCPVIFVPEHHNDADKDTAFNFDDVSANPPSGIVSGMPYWADDGWQWVDLLIWDESAAQAIEQNGFTVSCAYLVDETKEGGEWHQVPYDEEIVTGHYMHMAIVPRPRYEGSQILANSKGGHPVAIKLFGKKNAAPAAAAPAPANAAPPAHKEPDGDEGMMVNDDTEVDVNGTPVPLHELIAKYVEAQGGDPVALADTDMVALPDGSKVSVADLKAAWTGSGESAEGEGMENAEPPADTSAVQPVEVSRQKANAAPAKPATRVVNPALKNAAAKAGDTIDPRGEVDTEQARLARGKARYSRTVDQGGK